jgi:diacylglycerol kinase (ATP)
MRHLVVLNPRAGRRSRNIDAVAEALRRAGLHAEIVPTAGPGDAGAIVERRGREFESVIVAGGDGTLHEVLQALDLDRHRLGLVPLGTGNDFAWDEGWPRDPDACARRIAAEGERRLDVGTWRVETPGGAREGRFHNSVGFGFEALVNERSHRVRGVKGPLLYVAALAATLPRYRNYPVRLAWDGGGFDGTVSLLAAGLGKRVGGAFHAFPGADRTDGLLDLVFARGMNLPRALALAPRVMRGTHVGVAGVTTVRASTLRVAAPGGIPMYVDGEFVGRDVSACELRVLARAIRTF